MSEMKRIWFRAGYEAHVTEDELKELQKGNIDLMEEIIKRSELSGETYILGKDCGGVDDYDNPDEEINFLF